MTISIKKFIDITSGVGAGTVVQQRELIGRIFTINALVPTNTIIEFTTLTEVGDYFGYSSIEYLRAQVYFSYISKSITSADKISFTRWTDVNNAPQIFGAKLSTTLSGFQAITDGSFTLTLGATTHEISGLDFSTDLTLAAVAARIQAGINAEAGLQWTGATVVFDATRTSFNFTGGDPATFDAVSVSAGTLGTDIATIMGWFPQAVGASTTGAIWSNGAAAQTVTEVLDISTQTSNNFGSFLFMPTLTSTQVEEAASWNDLQNNEFMFCQRVVDLAQAVTYSALLANYGGTALTLAPLADEYPEMAPMIILAATDYDLRNANINYMFTQFNFTPSVTTTADSNAYDALKVNYYGLTQQAGQDLAFYQRGLLLGPSTSPSAMNVYANEAWLKDAITVELMSLFLNLDAVPANEKGISLALSQIESVVEQALFNGVISIGGVLSNTQKLFISQVTGDTEAWRQVQTAGYWLDANIASVTTNSVVEYKITYTLVYKKGDVVSSVTGTHILI